MIQINPHPPCWISSIVQLPMFYKPGTILYGLMASETNEIYEPNYIYLTQGRNIEIKPGLSKYKLEFRCFDTIFDVVGIALSPFDPQSIMDHRVSDIGFFPIFIHMGRDCFLFIEAINDLFSATNMVVSGTFSKVISPIGLIQGIDSTIYPGKLGDLYDARYARIQRQHRVIEIMMMELSSDSGPEHIQESLDDMYGIPDGTIPMEVQLLGNVRTVGDLRKFLNPLGNMPSDIATFAMYQNFDKMRAILNNPEILPEKVGDVYMTEPEDYSFTGAWLSGIYTQEFNDFQFQLRNDDTNVSDLYARRCHIYDGFRHSFERIVDWKTISDCLLLSFSSVNDIARTFKDNGDSNELIVQRSWLEDLVIKDQNDHICLYVDMVMWMLACADGLINNDNLMQLMGVCH